MVVTHNRVILCFLYAEYCHVKKLLSRHLGIKKYRELFTLSALHGWLYLNIEKDAVHYMNYVLFLFRLYYPVARCIKFVDMTGFFRTVLSHLIQRFRGFNFLSA